MFAQGRKSPKLPSSKTTSLDMKKKKKKKKKQKQRMGQRIEAFIFSIFQ
jgi:hypothetical protein